MDNETALYPMTMFPTDVMTPAQALAAGIAPFPGAEAYEVLPLARMTFKHYLARNEAELKQRRKAECGRWDA